MSKRPDTLTPMEIPLFLDSVLMKSSFGVHHRNGIRNYLMVLLMLDAGLRVGEVVKLKIQDLYLAGSPVSSLLIRKEISKGKRERLLPLTGRIQETICLMYEHWWVKLESKGLLYAFYSSAANIPFSTRQVENIVKRHAQQSIKREIHPHVLRHTFGTRLMRQVNSRIVQTLLGHKNIQTTQVYTHPNNDDLTDAIEKISTD